MSEEEGQNKQQYINILQNDMQFLDCKDTLVNLKGKKKQQHKPGSNCSERTRGYDGIGVNIVKCPKCKISSYFSE